MDNVNETETTEETIINETAEADEETTDNEETTTYNHLSATYSPDDNKLRLYSTCRLDKELYARVRAAGFIFAPKQDLFVAPMWTPAREDFLLELCGEIGDEDTSLIDRAEQRAERFEDYSDKRAKDANNAKRAVDSIADGIPFGQPILVGHHSERHARKDAERIENGMRKAVKMWETSKYWTDRAASAISHAKYKELPAVRHRRIKRIEADKRKEERSKAEAQKYLDCWLKCEAETDPDKQMKFALAIANVCWLHLAKVDPTDFSGPTAYDVLTRETPYTLQDIFAAAKRAYPRTIAHCDRWIAHYENRLAYERAMLGEVLGTNGDKPATMADRFDIKVGGKVLTGRDEWLIVLKVNKVKGIINSVTTQAPRAVYWSKQWKYSIEEIKDYEAPTEEMAEKVKKATALPPLCNYPGEGFKHMTEAEYKQKKGRGYSDFSYVKTIESTQTTGAHRVRRLPAPGWSYEFVFLTDAKLTNPPRVEAKEDLPREFKDAPAVRLAPAVTVQRKPRKVEERTEFDDMKDALKTGIKVVSAPQLFPTPVEIAEQVIELAEIEDGHEVLEPSAGTGALLKQIPDSCKVTAIEINYELAKLSNARCADFLEVEPQANFDRIVMNPPFENASDIKHVEHALKFLKAGGKLVSIVANGPRQQAKLKPMAETWIDLPVGSFKNAGTNVNAAICVIRQAG